MVLTSDGITEAHNAEGEMYGFGRLMDRVARRPINDDVLNAVVAELEAFTGEGAEQEDDITLVVVKRTSSAKESAETFEERRQVLAKFAIPSEEGNERIAIAKVTAAVDDLGLEPARLERLKTAVGETVMNAIEHGNENRSELDVDVQVCANDGIDQCPGQRSGWRQVDPRSHRCPTSTPSSPESKPLADGVCS